MHISYDIIALPQSPHTLQHRQDCDAYSTCRAVSVTISELPVLFPENCAHPGVRLIASSKPEKTTMLVLSLCCVWSVMAAPTTYLLQNAADANVNMPISGLGTGGYGNAKHRALGV